MPASPTHPSTTATSRAPSPLRKLAALSPILIVLTGFILTLWMAQTTLRSGAPLTTDSALQVLLTQQIAQQLSNAQLPLTVALTAPDATWTPLLEQQGLYPFAPPSVYTVGNQQFGAFPFIFPLISAPLYALFGNPGLYALPLAALWSIWLRFWAIGKRAGWSTLALCLGLIGLIFASPLSGYGNLYQPTTLAIALAFWGLSALVPITAYASQSHSGQQLVKATLLSRPQLLSSGILIGLAVWFQPAFIYLVAVICLLALIGCLLPSWNLTSPLTLVKAAILIGGMACTVGALFALNYGVYGYPLGLPAMQLNLAAFTSGPQQIAAFFTQQLSSLTLFFPIALVVFIAALFSPEFKRASRKTKNRFKGYKTAHVERVGIIAKPNNTPANTARFMLSVSILWILGLPLMLRSPNTQPFQETISLLPIPLLSIVLSEQLQPKFFRRWARTILIVSTVIVIILGIYKNALAL
ncbi:MAG: hypothetical protein AAFV90_04415 [Cyanobacteria bacterium J06634_5]